MELDERDRARNLARLRRRRPPPHPSDQLELPLATPARTAIELPRSPPGERGWGKGPREEPGKGPS